jgi:hypothetical protein
VTVASLRDSCKDCATAVLARSTTAKLVMVALFRLREEKKLPKKVSGYMERIVVVSLKFLGKLLLRAVLFAPGDLMKADLVGFMRRPLGRGQDCLLLWRRTASLRGGLCRFRSRARFRAHENLRVVI